MIVYKVLEKLTEMKNEISQVYGFIDGTLPPPTESARVGDREPESAIKDS